MILNQDQLREMILRGILISLRLFKLKLCKIKINYNKKKIKEKFQEINNLHKNKNLMMEISYHHYKK